MKKFPSCSSDSFPVGNYQRNKIASKTEASTDVVDSVFPAHVQNKPNFVLA